MVEARKTDHVHKRANDPIHVDVLAHVIVDVDDGFSSRF